MLTRPHLKRHIFRPCYFGFARLIVVFFLAACTAANAQSVTIATAGDIACSPDSDGNYNGGQGTPTACQMKATSDLILERGVDAVLTLGDNQYSQGRLGAFEASFDKTWGRFKAMTYPSPGNHEYLTTQGRGYYAYFGDAPQTPEGEADAEGVRQFVVGTGGKELRPMEQERANSETFVSDFGVLFLTLNEDSYDWSFIATSGETLDSGTGSCR